MLNKVQLFDETIRSLKRLIRLYPSGIPVRYLEQHEDAKGQELPHLTRDQHVEYVLGNEDASFICAALETDCSQENLKLFESIISKGLKISLSDAALVSFPSIALMTQAIASNANFRIYFGSADCKPSERMHSTHALLDAPSLEEIGNSASAKRRFWQQLKEFFLENK